MKLNNSPFKFLDSYNKTDADIFFGREQETLNLYNALSGVKHLLIYGPSGAGKTSLIECGLRNQFSDADWFAITIRRVDNIQDSLSNNIYSLTRPNSIVNLKEKEEFDLIEAISELFDKYYQPIYLIFDQFEELLLLGSEEEKEWFFKEIYRLISVKLPCRVLLVMREEFVGLLSNYEPLFPSVFKNRFRLDKVNKSRIVDIISSTLSSTRYSRSIKVTDNVGLAQSIISQLPDSRNEIELTHLQVFLSQLWSRAVQNQKNNELPILNVDLIYENDNLANVLDGFFKNELNQFDNDFGEGSTLNFLSIFLSSENTKLQLNHNSIEDRLKELGFDFEINTSFLLESLIKRKIIRVISINGIITYEISHDLLAQVIHNNLSEDIILREKAKRVFKLYEEREAPLSLIDLEYLKPYRAFAPYSANLKDVIDSSVNFHKQELIEKNKIKRRRGIVLVSLSILSVIGFIMAALMTNNFANVNEKLNETLQKVIASDSISNLKTKELSSKNQELQNSDSISNLKSWELSLKNQELQQTLNKLQKSEKILSKSQFELKERLEVNSQLRTRDMNIALAELTYENDPTLATNIAYNNFLSNKSESTQKQLYRFLLDDIKLKYKSVIEKDEWGIADIALSNSKDILVFSTLSGDIFFETPDSLFQFDSSYNDQLMIHNLAFSNNDSLLAVTFHDLINIYNNQGVEINYISNVSDLNKIKFTAKNRLLSLSKKSIPFTINYKSQLLFWNENFSRADTFDFTPHDVSDFMTLDSNIVLLALGFDGFATLNLTNDSILHIKSSEIGGLYVWNLARESNSKKDFYFSSGSNLHKYDMRNGQISLVHTYHKSFINSIDVNSKYILSGDNTGVSYLYNLKTFEVYSLNGGKDAISSVKIVDNNKFITGAIKSNLKKWEVEQKFTKSLIELPDTCTVYTDILSEFVCEIIPFGENLYKYDSLVLNYTWENDKNGKLSLKSKSNCKISEPYLQFLPSMKSLIISYDSKCRSGFETTTIIYNILSGGIDTLNLDVNEVTASKSDTFILAIDYDSCFVFNNLNLVAQFEPNFSPDDICVFDNGYSLLISESGEDISVYSLSGALLWSYKFKDDYCLSFSNTNDLSSIIIGTGGGEILFFNMETGLTPKKSISLSVPIFEVSLTEKFIIVLSNLNLLIFDLFGNLLYKINHNYGIEWWTTHEMKVYKANNEVRLRLSDEIFYYKLPGALYNDIYQFSQMELITNGYIK